MNDKPMSKLEAFLSTTLMIAGWAALMVVLVCFALLISIMTWEVIQDGLF